MIVDDGQRHALVGALIRSVATRSASEQRRAVSALIGRCWPRGGDRTEPAALPWVRRWGPVTVPVAPLACSCATGRCTVCN